MERESPTSPDDSLPGQPVEKANGRGASSSSLEAPKRRGRPPKRRDPTTSTEPEPKQRNPTKSSPSSQDGQLLDSRRRSNRIARPTYRPELETSVCNEDVDELLANHGIPEESEELQEDSNDSDFQINKNSKTPVKKRTKTTTTTTKSQPLTVDRSFVRCDRTAVGRGHHSDYVIDVSSSDDDDAAAALVLPPNLPPGISVHAAKPAAVVVDLSSSDGDQQQSTPVKSTKIDGLSLSSPSGRKRAKKKITPLRPASERPLLQSQYKQALRFAAGGCGGGKEEDLFVIKSVESLNRHQQSSSGGQKVRGAIELQNMMKDCGYNITIKK